MLVQRAILSLIAPRLYTVESLGVKEATGQARETGGSYFCGKRLSLRC